MSQLTPTAQQTFQMPLPQGAEQLAPVTPDMVQSSIGNLGKLPATLMTCMSTQLD